MAESTPSLLLKLKNKCGQAHKLVQICNIQQVQAGVPRVCSAQYSKTRLHARITREPRLPTSSHKRRKSSSSLGSGTLGATERKLDLRASIPEVEDQFTLAEERCNKMQQKINLVKALKRKKKNRKSLTKVNLQQSCDNLPVMSVRTQPKKLPSPGGTRPHRPVQMTPNRRLESAVDQVTLRNKNHAVYNAKLSHGRMPKETISKVSQKHSSSKIQYRRGRPEGDTRITHSVQASTFDVLDACVGYNGDDCYMVPSTTTTSLNRCGKKVISNNCLITPINTNTPKVRRNKYNLSSNYGQKLAGKTSSKANTIAEGRGEWDNTPYLPPDYDKPYQLSQLVENINAENAVVELFNNEKIIDDGRSIASQMEAVNKKSRERKSVDVGDTKRDWQPHVKYRTRRYELPTVASQMKQTGMRHYSGDSNQTRIPFVVSMSTAPSHNIGVNIQQVLNGMKMQMPLSGIPLTMAHHMGLGHISLQCKTLKNPQLEVSLNNQEINAIKLGQRLLRLPSYKYMSYNRMLTLYREGEGVVSKFLRSLSKPHYFYTSMYNLTSPPGDYDGSTSKGLAANNEARQTLAEYANLYRKFEEIDRRIKEGNRDPELEQRRAEISKELVASEEHVRKVVHEYKIGGDGDPIRASMSGFEEFVPSIYKPNVGGDH